MPYVNLYITLFAGNTDFEPLNSEVATVSSSSNACFTISITDDNVCEEREQFTIFFTVDLVVPTSISTARVTRNPSQAVVFIEDNDCKNDATT